MLCSKKDMIRLLFFGTSQNSLLVLEKLLTFAEFKVVGVVTKAPKPVGRKQDLQETPAALLAEKRHLPIFTPSNKKELLELAPTLKRLAPDLGIVADYGLMIPKEIFLLPKYQTLNLHPSLLPKDRGPSPVQQAILDGKTLTGVSIILLSEKMDGGDILAQVQVEITPHDTTPDLLTKCFKLGAKLLINLIPLWLNRKLTPKKQDETKATYTQLLTREQGQIDWLKDPEFIDRQIRALQPWPGAFTYLNNLKAWLNQIIDEGSSFNPRIKILKARLASPSQLKLEKLQVEGKKPVSWEEFESGYLHPHHQG